MHFFRRGTWCAYAIMDLWTSVAVSWNHIPATSSLHCASMAAPLKHCSVSWKKEVVAPSLQHRTHLHRLSYSQREMFMGHMWETTTEVFLSTFRKLNYLLRSWRSMYNCDCVWEIMNLSINNNSDSWPHSSSSLLLFPWTASTLRVSLNMVGVSSCFPDLRLHTMHLFLMNSFPWVCIIFSTRVQWTKCRISVPSLTPISLQPNTNTLKRLALLLLDLLLQYLY